MRRWIRAINEIALHNPHAQLQLVLTSAGGSREVILRVRTHENKAVFEGLGVTTSNRKEIYEVVSQELDLKELA